MDSEQITLLKDLLRHIAFYRMNGETGVRSEAPHSSFAAGVRVRERTMDQVKALAAETLGIDKMGAHHYSMAITILF